MKKVRPYITVKDKEAEPVLGEADVELRDTEIVPFTYPGGIKAFMEHEVVPYTPDAYVDEKKTQVGYEISFTKYFYNPAELRSIKSIVSDLSMLEKESDGMLAGIIGGLDDEQI